MKASIDYETSSTIDLKDRGLDVYADPEHTSILCMAYAIEDEPVELWIPGMPFPIDLEIHLSEGGEIYAHNASFEWSIWNKVATVLYGWPKLPIEQTHCNMVMGLTQGLPGSLEKLAIALKLSEQKDMAGSRVMMQLSKPRKILPDGTVIWWEKKDVPEKYQTLYEYCIKDVEVERAAGKKLKPLSPQQRKIWLLDHKINQRGIQIDLASVALAETVIEQEKCRLDAEMREITNSKVASCTAAKQIVDFLNANGAETDSVAKANVTNLLASDIPEICKDVLRLRQEGSKSSTAKLGAMALRASKDGRVRNTAQYHGAHTGRWAGRGIQLQNLKRPNIKFAQIEKIIANLKEGAEFINIFYGAASDVISDCMRSFITASEGKELHANDWSNIEGRALSWLADETWKMKAFADFDKGIGADIYILSYSASFHVALERVTSDERQIGKVLELSMGFGGGVGAFQNMARNYGVIVSNERAEELKVAWRNVHPNIVRYWKQLENAAINAVNEPAKTFNAGPSDHRQIKFRVEGDFLMCRLPSGRFLYYPFPTIKQVPTPWGELKGTVSYMTEDSTTRQWVRTHAHGGVWCENITQAVSADILAESLLRLEDNEYPIVFHVHDEIISETDLNTKTLETMSQLMCVLPTWANGLPIRATGWTGKRYRK